MAIADISDFNSDFREEAPVEYSYIRSTSTESNTPTCPECGTQLFVSGHCATCPGCGFSLCAM